MAKLSDVQAKIRRTKWAFLAEMLGETNNDDLTHEVGHTGLLLVNPNRAVLQRTDVLTAHVRTAFARAQLER